MKRKVCFNYAEVSPYPNCILVGKVTVLVYSDKVSDCLQGVTCDSDEQKAAAVANAESLSAMLDSELNDVCSDNPTSDACRTSVNSAIQYIGMEDAWNVLEEDVSRSSTNTFDYVYNSDGAEENFDVYFNTIDNRADFFGASDQYEQNIGLGAKWYGGAEFVSRAPATGLGADGAGSWISFAVGGVLTGAPVYDWRDDAGSTLVNAGFKNFKSLYNKEEKDPLAWDINQLREEQKSLQPVHEKHLSDNNAFVDVSKFFTDSSETFNPVNYLPNGEKQTMEGGINVLDYESRVEYGCILLGYTEAQGCKP